MTRKRRVPAVESAVPTGPFPKDSAEPKRGLDAGVHLLDRQILDCNLMPVATVSDIELEGVAVNTDIDPRRPAPTIAALLDGPILRTRIFGGRPPDSELQGVRWTDVTHVGSAITIRVPGEQLDITWRERWIRDRIIARIPGGRHDPE